MSSVGRVDRASLGLRCITNDRIRAWTGAGKPSWTHLTTITPREFSTS